MLKGLAITPPVIGRISIGRIVEKNGKCVFRTNVTGRFGIVTGDFGNVTGHLGNVTERTGRQDWRCV
ncbi:hypothetical protein [Burkholderia vietnamiensis]|uniref:hypothetical protein n=1 Tax=Burkholderia vietnamiensis TaxID=60552 RepID=UPI0009C0C8A1|nr:hypothetical protein [Burkholderia vietnamiensis]